MSCPPYYELVDGREFAEFCRETLVPYLKPRTGSWSIHCLLSAMEHRFRRDFKHESPDHDLTAERWWLEQASLHHHAGLYSWLRIQSAVTVLVDVERESKKDRIPRPVDWDDVATIQDPEAKAIAIGLMKRVDELRG